MSAPGAAPQTNGIPPSGPSASQTQPHQAATPSQPQPTTTPTPSQQQPQPQQPQSQQQQPPSQQQTNPQQTPTPTPAPQATTTTTTTTTAATTTAATTTTAPRPRDARTIELLLTAQGVTAFEQRVPLLLLDFAYRHASSILSDALHLSADPYVSQAGARPSAAAGAAPVNVGDAAVTGGAVQLAIASRLGFQFRGGGGGGIGGGGGGGTSKDWLMELARERNKIALPRVQPSEWGVRLPGERFVLSGVSWGLRDVWAGQDGAEESSSEEGEGGDAMMVDGPGPEAEDVGGDGVEGGTMDDVFGDEGMEDEEMAEA